MPDDMRPLPPLAPNPAALDFLLTRRSRPAKTLGAAGPDAATLTRLLTAAARVPDHGKLEPWRFVVIEGAAREGFARLAETRAQALGRSAEDAAKAGSAFRQGAVIVAVVASPKPSGKIPAWEQAMSAGAVCLSLVNAALAAGWGACWLSGPVARDRVFLDALGLAAHEVVAGFVHIGAETAAPPDRPRPDVTALVARLDGPLPAAADAPAARAVNLRDKLAAFTERWSPKIVAAFNDCDVMVVKVEGEFVWRAHPDTDDFFLVLDGSLRIETERGDVTLGPGELHVVPAGVRHRPVAERETHVLLIEPRGTPNTGDPATAARKTAL